MVIRRGSTENPPGRRAGFILELFHIVFAGFTVPMKWWEPVPGLFTMYLKLTYILVTPDLERDQGGYLLVRGGTSSAE